MLEQIHCCQWLSAPAVKLPSSAFSTKSVNQQFSQLTLADLHRVSPITDDRLATTLPPPSLPYAGIFASHYWARWFESSLVPIENVIAPLSCLLYTGWSLETVLNTGIVI